MSKNLTLYDKWKIDSDTENPVGFLDQKINKVNDNDLFKIIKKIEKCESKLNSDVISKRDKKKLRNTLDELAEELKVLNENELEKKLDEGLPSETGKYNGMDYEEILARALQMENDAVEINLMLLEIAPDEDRKKFVEIANDENDHSLIYQGIINRLQGVSK